MADAKLTLTFGRPRGDALVLEAATGELELDDGRLKIDGKDTALHVNHQWEADGVRFSRFDVEEQVDIRMHTEERTSRIFGPYAHFSCVDGVAYVDGRIFAFYDEQAKDWYGFDDGRHWRRLVVCRAARRGP